MSRTTPRALAAVFAAAAFGCLIPVSAMHLGDEMKWGDGPPTLPKGAKAAVLQGDPGTNDTGGERVGESCPRVAREEHR